MARVPRAGASSTGVSGLPRESGDEAFDALAAEAPGTPLAALALEAKNTPWKSKGTAAAWSMVPGLGQLYVGEKASGAEVARARVWEMDTFAHTWGEHAVGLIDLEVPPERRRQGFAKFLLTRIILHLQEQFFSLIEAQTPPDNLEAVFESLDAIVTPPVIEKQQQMQDAVSAVLDQVKAGDMTPQEALDQAKTDIETLIAS